MFFVGELKGHQWQPSEIAVGLWKRGVRDTDLVELTATILAESQGFDHANNKGYLDAAHTQLVHEDIGIGQINVKAADLDGRSVAALWTFDGNLDRVVAMFRDRGYSPWYGHAVAMKPEARGEYIQRAAWGVMNMHRLRFGLKPLPYPGRRRARLRALLGLPV